MLGRADLRGKTLILFLLSTGVRIGAVPELRLRHRTRFAEFKVSRFTIYEGAKEEYETFCTPECDMHLERYLADRARAGEVLTGESPLFREQFDPDDKDAVSKPRPMAKFTIASYIRELAKRCGIRASSGDKQKRQQVMLMHGFRKFFNTRMIEAGVIHQYKEMLMGHKTGSLDVASYAKPEDLLKEYLKGAKSLSIMETSALERELAEAKEKLAAGGDLRERVAALERMVGPEVSEAARKFAVKEPMDGEFGEPHEVTGETDGEMREG
jgi:integrase